MWGLEVCLVRMLEKKWWPVSCCQSLDNHALGVYEQSTNHISLKKKAPRQVKAGCVSANTRPPQLHWVTGKWGLLSHAQNAVGGLASSERLVEAFQRHLLFMQLSFMLLSFNCLKIVAIVIQAINDSTLPSICYNVFIQT